MTTRHPDLSTGAWRANYALKAGELRRLLEAVEALPSARPGLRLFGAQDITATLAPSGAVGALARSLLPDAFPVRAILFDKTAEANWALPWHQDRVIAVRRRVEVDGFGPWSRKAGMLHVQPPFDLLTGMITLRVHLDAVDETNAPLLVAPGSHALGRIPEGDVANVAKRCGILVCTAEPGDVWVYSTPILHASEVARRPRRRRVVQVDYAAENLPGGLEWTGLN